MIYILHYLKDPKLWELWHTPYVGNAGIVSSINSSLRRECWLDSTQLGNIGVSDSGLSRALGHMFPFLI